MIMTALLEAKHNRTTTVIALGGGVVGDMAVLLRQRINEACPLFKFRRLCCHKWTLLSAEKPVLITHLVKNMIGAFYQPQAVIIDTETLLSLPQRELSAGMAEVIKYGLICDVPFFRLARARKCLT